MDERDSGYKKSCMALRVFLGNCGILVYLGHADLLHPFWLDEAPFAVTSREFSMLCQDFSRLHPKP